MTADPGKPVAYLKQSGKALSIHEQVFSLV
jgi:hypothetical protein